MNKMERPMMTIVRFGAEDVIATSSPVLANGHYSALGSEIKEYADIVGSFSGLSGVKDDNGFYKVDFDDNLSVSISAKSDQYKYAWYNKNCGCWLTDEQTKDYYGGNLPQ